MNMFLSRLTADSAEGYFSYFWKNSKTFNARLDTVLENVFYRSDEVAIEGSEGFEDVNSKLRKERGLGNLPGVGWVARVGAAPIDGYDSAKQANDEKLLDLVELKMVNDLFIFGLWDLTSIYQIPRPIHIGVLITSGEQSSPSDEL